MLLRLFVCMAEFVETVPIKEIIFPWLPSSLPSRPFDVRRFHVAQVPRLVTQKVHSARLCRMWNNFIGSRSPISLSG